MDMITRLVIGLIPFVILGLIVWGIASLIISLMKGSKKNAKMISDSIKEAAGTNKPYSYEEYQEMKKKAKEDPGYAQFLKSQGIDVSEQK